MKNRTIEELHDKHCGHRKMAAIVDGLLALGYQVTDIKEYNEKFKFKVNGYDLQYGKEWKSSAKAFVKYIVDLYEMKESIRKGERTLWTI